MLDDPLRPDHGAAAGDSTVVGRAQQQLLRSVHQHLRDELTQIRDVVAQVIEGSTDLESARHLINHLTVRQNYWTLGSFCAAYCRVVAIHHTIEDETMFPGLATREPQLVPVIERLGEEHETIAGILTRLDEALVAMVADDTALAQVQELADELSTQLLAHLAFEEERLLPAIGRLADRVI
jgi:hemerythrin-like domain-containing protein